MKYMFRETVDVAITVSYGRVSFYLGIREPDFDQADSVLTQGIRGFLKVCLTMKAETAFLIECSEKLAMATHVSRILCKRNAGCEFVQRTRTG